MEYPKVTVIAPIYNEHSYIRSFVHNLLNQTYPEDRLELLLIDGGSTDGTRQILEEAAADFPRITLLDNPQRYVPYALNLGISRASGSIICRMDAHAEYPLDYIEELVYWLDKSGADNVGGVWHTLPSKKTRMARAIALALASPFGVGDARYRLGGDRPREVDTVPFGCYRRELFDRIGVFDRDLLRNQDDEFNARLIRSGGRILLLPHVGITYYSRPTLGALASKMYNYGLYKPLVNIKLGKPATWRQFAPPVLLLTLGLFLVLGWIWPWAGYAFVCLIALYGLFLLLGALRCRPAGLLEGACTVLAMACMHFSYGLGYLQGVFRYWLLPRIKGTSKPDSGS